MDSPPEDGLLNDFILHDMGAEDPVMLRKIEEPGEGSTGKERIRVKGIVCPWNPTASG